MKLHLSITESNISKARKQSKCFCPIGLAIIDQLDIMATTRKETNGKRLVNLEHGSVDAASGTLYWDKSDWRFRLPNNAQEFIARRDLGEPVEPIAFEIDCQKWTPRPQTDWSVIPVNCR